MFPLCKKVKVVKLPPLKILNISPLIFNDDDDDDDRESVAMDFVD